MAQLILFNGGDVGGLLVGPNGVRPIPPLDIEVRRQLRGLSALLNGSNSMTEKPAHEMATLTNRVSNLLIGQVEGIVGPLEGDRSLVYQDEDGGFYCGNTGKPPVPIRWPPRSFPSLGDLIAAGVLERELVDFLNKAGEKKMEICDVLEDPTGAAHKLGVRLSERTIKDLQQVAPSRVEKISDPVSREVVQFFHQVAKDGRFLTTWATRPYQVADQLKVQLSDAALERILAAGASTASDPSGRACIVVIYEVVFLVIILAIVLTPDEAHLVRDSSGMEKF